jgi:molybdopterin converting factor small subunit
MSSLGQLSTRLDRRLQVVGELTKALLALRAELTGKLDALKLTTADVDTARVRIIEFLAGLTSALNGTPPASEEQRVFLAKLAQSGEPLTDWAEDFGKIVGQLQARAPVESSQLDKIMRVVGFLQGEAAEDVRRLRSR